MDDLLEATVAQDAEEFAGSEQARARLEKALLRLNNVIGQHLERTSRPTVEISDYQRLEAHCEALKAENLHLREQLRAAEEATNKATASLDAIITQVEAMMQE